MQKNKIIRPTPEEDRQINEGIAADPDTLELTEEIAKQLRPATRGKQKAPTKVPATVRYSPEVIETYKGLGKGWQTRMDCDLKELIARKYRRVEQNGQLVTVERKSKN